MFLPVTLLYSSEIRMYSWAAVLVTLTGIYAYRIIRKESNIKIGYYLVYLVYLVHIHIILQ